MGKNLVMGKPVLSSNDMQAAGRALLRNPKEITEGMKKMEPWRLHAFKVKIREYKKVLAETGNGKTRMLLGAKTSASRVLAEGLSELARNDTDLPENALRDRRTLLMGLENIPLKPHDQQLLERKARLEREIGDIFEGNEKGMRLCESYEGRYRSFALGTYSHPGKVFGALRQ